MHRITQYAELHCTSISVILNKKREPKEAPHAHGAATHYFFAGPAILQLVTCDTPAGKLALTVCYDLRFPEMWQKLAFEMVGVDVLHSLSLLGSVKCSSAVLPGL